MKPRMSWHTAAACMAFLPLAANAVPVTGSQVLNFDAGKQSLWGPNGSAASFRASGSFGNSTLGFQYSAQASTGTVESASFDGRLNYNYETDIGVSSADLFTFGFTGTPGGGFFETLFGASFEMEYRLLGGTGCVYCRGASLNVTDAFTPRLDTNFSGSDVATPIAPTVGPDVGVGAAQAGIDFDVKQTSTLRVNGISGSITATNSATGAVKNTSLNLVDNSLLALDLGLDEVGLWSVSLTDLTLDNTFFSSFGLSLAPFAQYFLGVGCGELDDDDDNGLLCAGDGKAKWNAPSISMGSTDAFALSFNNLNLSPFLVSVRADGPVGVPEPSSLALLGAGLLGFIGRRSIKNRRRGAA